MKKSVKKFVAAIAVITILIGVVVNFRVNADTLVTEIPEHNDELASFGVREVHANSIYLSSEPAYEDYPTAEVHLLLLSGEEEFAGYEGQLFFEGAYPTGEIVSLMPEWNVTSNVDPISNCINFVVEPVDLGKIRPSSELVIKYQLDPETECGYAYINKDTFKKTDLYNNVTKPLEGISDVPYDFCVALEKLSGSPIASNDTRAVRIQGDKIFAKFEGTMVNGYRGIVTNVRDLYDMITINTEDWAYLEIITDNGSMTLGNEEKNFSSSDNIDSVLTAIDNIRLVLAVINEQGGISYYSYNVVQMGNTYADDVFVGGVININDVIALRRAIVGMNDVWNDLCFNVDASDVNFSNDDLESLGDIGDIISIRQRILNYYWLDK